MNHSRAVALIVLVISTVAAMAQAGASGPQGGRIAFGSQRYGHTNNIFTMNADGSDVRQLTFMKKADGADLRQQWSPDGTKLVFEHRDKEGTFRQIWIINADGSDKHELVHDPAYRDFAPSYSPDGSRIAFERCRPDFEACAIYSSDADGGDLTEITPFKPARNIVDASPKYSPDGKTIAFGGFNRNGVAAAIYLIDANGGTATQLTRRSLSATDPDWSPDGSRLVFWSNCCVPGQPGIWSIGADGNDEVKLAHPGLQRFDFSPDYSPDGTKIAFEWDHDDGTSNVVTINTDGSDRTRIQRDAFLPVWQPVS